MATLRILLFLIIAALISLGINWVVTNNGEIHMMWLGYEITTTVAFVIFSLIFAVILLLLIFQILFTLLSFPGKINRKIKNYQLEQNLKQLQVGYAALLSGDYDQARRISSSLMDSPSKNKSVENLSQMLIAKVAQEDGNKQLADDYFDKFMGSKKHKFFAVKGKLDSAFKAGEIDEAISYAEEAYRIKPHTKDGAHSLLELYKKADRLDKAEEFLNRYKNKHRFFSDKYNVINTEKELAGIWFAKAKDIHKKADGFKAGNERAMKYIEKCLAIDPNNVEYVKLALSICKDMKNDKKAKIIMEKAWRNTQSIELGSIYLDAISTGNSAEDTKKKLKAIEGLKKINFNPDIIDRLRDKIYDIEIEY